MAQGYHERHGLYPVNPKMREVQGLRCYPTVLDCPDPVDHVICQIPRVSVSELIEPCVAKGVRLVHFFTAGFSESRDDEMAAVERGIVRKARAGGVRLIGPNCMGLYSPADELTFMPGLPHEPGSVLMLSQSSTNAGDIVYGLAARGERARDVQARRRTSAGPKLDPASGCPSIDMLQAGSTALPTMRVRSSPVASGADGAESVSLFEVPGSMVHGG